jgi:hypothetical protein
VNNVRFGSQAELPARGEDRVHDGHAERSYPTPAEFVWQFSRVIAFCLGLAVLAHVIVAVVGTQ